MLVVCCCIFHLFGKIISPSWLSCLFFLYLFRSVLLTTWFLSWVTLSIVNMACSIRVISRVLIIVFLLIFLRTSIIFVLIHDLLFILHKLILLNDQIFYLQLIFNNILLALLKLCLILLQNKIILCHFLDHLIMSIMNLF